MKSFFISIFYFLYFFTSCNSLIKKDNQYAAVDYDYHLYLNATLNDSINLKLILDTGANGFYIDSTFCNKNKMKANISSIYVRGVGEKKQQVSILNNHSTLNLNNEIKPYDKIPILNLKKIIGSKIDGIIGNDFFRDKIVFIDYHKEEVKISNDIKNVNLKNFYVFPFTQDITKGVVINLNLKIDNKDFKGNYLVDTGSPQFLTFTKTTALERRLDTIKSKKKIYSENYGIGGASMGYVFPSKSLMLNNVEISNPVFDFSIDKSGSLSGSEDYLGIIGNRFLENFVVIIDYKNSILYLKPNNDGNNKFEDKYAQRFLGFSAIDNTYSSEGWIVSGLFENEKNQGLEMGDIIIKVNKVSTTNILRKDFYKMFNRTVNELEIIRKNQRLNVEFRKKMFYDEN